MKRKRTESSVRRMGPLGAATYSIYQSARKV
jgi:hypothetical protein